MNDAGWGNNFPSQVQGEILIISPSLSESTAQEGTYKTWALKPEYGIKVFILLYTRALPGLFVDLSQAFT